MKSNQLPVLGFLGAGAIVSAMVRGFCERAQDTPYHLVVSDMRPEACEALRNQYPERVSVASSLQECVNQSDWVIIAVWPQAGEEVIRSLQFRPDHKIINVMFDKTVEEIRSWMNTDVSIMLHMIPGTYLSFYPGPIVQCPCHPGSSRNIWPHRQNCQCRQSLSGRCIWLCHRSVRPYFCRHGSCN